ncbi:beta-ketoacyl-[acyl-carrier-protein] synthase family protein [Culturomica massiliensis]|jgi:3-oxoacyl-[acyl-carrier-protein] synthase-1|uniref:beta-ketoacyl-[acyl-carrier-protein] synthase family protein n=1 Tax=Culturomica massiliensis TaxID=1841857 RepID=UPI000E55C244|nr:MULTISPECIES: beta-ketoacyl-[acyl-carrier-protein] synthase family protein [Odoribacteraceae]RHV86781.1 beta-ketoacyl-[acyl-carrier-protein] synthase family protein [Odoribacter sp. OF09-27XD]
MKRVVITGIGIHSSIGSNVDEVLNSLKFGKSGIGIEHERKEYGYKSPLVGIVPKVNLKNTLSRSLRITLSEEAEYAYLATQQAMEDANVNDEYLDGNEVGIIYGNDSSVKANVEVHENVLKHKSTSRIGSGAIFQTMTSSVTMNLSTIYRLKGINLSISAACASGSHSIGQGYLMIKQGLQDMIVCGGAQETNYYALPSFDALGVFASNVENPSRALRPFDINRSGLVPSGGAATLILEEFGHAIKRGAHIYAEVIGYGFSSNGKGISEPCRIGAKKSMNMALKNANIFPENIDYINAHATSTPKGDAEEAIALNDIFGRYCTPVSSTKSMTGHECWMAGASEIVYTILMMQNSFIAPNINFETPDEYSEGLNIISDPISKTLDICLSNSFGFGGTNSTLIIKKI